MENFKSQEAERLDKHLNPDVKPIMACLDTVVQSKPPQLSGEIEQIDLYANPEKAREKGFIKEGERAYVISPIDNKNKFSEDYRDCTGIVAVGNDLITKENISFLSHQNPSYFLFAQKEKFIRDLNQRLAEIKGRCEPGTVDIVVFGGQYLKAQNFPDDHKVQKFFKEQYTLSIKLLSEQIEQQFDFSPAVITGPKFGKGQDVVAFDNLNRRLYLLRTSEQPLFTNSFDAKEVESSSVNWKPGEISLGEYLGKDKK